MRPRRSEGRWTVSPPSATAIYHRPIALARLQLAVTDHHRPSQALLAGGGDKRAHPLKPAISSQNSSSAVWPRSCSFPDSLSETREEARLS
jgi:hypothetical protein